MLTILKIYIFKEANTYVYDANRISGLGSINVEPDARFCHEHAAMQAVIESQQNALIMFENNLAVDFQEAAMIHEGAYAEDIEALHENVFTDIFKRIKDLFMKLWAKIKSIFKVFIAKFDSIFMKSSKEFIKKYKKDVLKKDLTDVTINYSKPKGVQFVISSGLLITVKRTDKDELEKELENYDSEKQEEEYIKTLTGLTNTTLADFDKEYHEHCYEDESKEDLTTSLLSDAIATLEGSDDILKKVKKANDILNKAIGNIIKEIDNIYTSDKIYLDSVPTAIEFKYMTNAGTSIDLDIVSVGEGPSYALEKDTITEIVRSSLPSIGKSVFFRKQGRRVDMEWMVTNKNRTIYDCSEPYLTGLELVSGVTQSSFKEFLGGNDETYNGINSDKKFLFGG